MIWKRLSTISFFVLEKILPRNPKKLKNKIKIDRLNVRCKIKVKFVFESWVDLSRKGPKKIIQEILLRG